MDWGIEGQICLYFNDKEIGFYEKEVNIGNEYLSPWFIKLLETVKQLKKNKKSFACLEETTNVLHFVLCDSRLQVAEGKMESQHISGRISTYSPSNILEIYWKEDIDYDEFQKEVLHKAKQYIEEVSSYNENFLETMDYRELKNLLF